MPPQYNEYEPQFLPGVAKELNLDDIDTRFFEARASQKFTYKYKTNTQLVRDKEFLKIVYPSEYSDNILGSLANSAENKLKDVLKKIKPKIKEKSWRLEEKEIIDWKDLILFLRTIYFEEWWKKNHSDTWENLWKKVTRLTGIAINSKKIATADFDLSAWGEQEEEMPTFPWNSELRYEIEAQQEGYLTLIQKYASEKIYLFSPSCLVRQPYEPAPNHQFPRSGFLPLKAGIAGVDCVIAIISQNKPTLSYIKTEDQKPLQLKESDLQELYNFLEREPNSEIMGTKFRIVSVDNTLPSL